jgi:hypothetical protein
MERGMMKLLINLKKIHSRSWPKHVASQTNMPKHAKTKNSLRQSDPSSQPTSCVADQKLLKIYKAMDLAG